MKTPVDELMSAPFGAWGSRKNESVSAGSSVSVAEAVNVSCAATFADRIPIGSSTGGVFELFDAVTKTMNDSVSLRPS